jgi:hypothetical protein
MCARLTYLLKMTGDDSCHISLQEHCDLAFCKQQEPYSPSFPMARLPQSHLKLRIAWLFCVLLPALLLLVYFMFPCKHCLGPEKFTASSPGGLRNHQNKCEGHLRHQGEAAGHRRSAAALSKKKRSKLSDRKARLVCLWYFCMVP